jgi:hypothetical protein
MRPYQRSCVELMYVCEVCRKFLKEIGNKVSHMVNLHVTVYCRLDGISEVIQSVTTWTFGIWNPSTLANEN